MRSAFCCSARATWTTRSRPFSVLKRQTAGKRKPGNRVARLQLGDADNAIREFEIALHLRPQDTGFQTNLGVAYLQKTDFDAAAAQFQSALQSSPSNTTLHYDLGLALKLKDKLPEAVAEFRTAEQLDPRQADVHYTLGVTLWQQGDFAAAAGELQAAIDAKPDYAEAFTRSERSSSNKANCPRQRMRCGKRLASSLILRVRTPLWPRCFGNSATRKEPPSRPKRELKLASKKTTSKPHCYRIQAENY